LIRWSLKSRRVRLRGYEFTQSLSSSTVSQHSQLDNGEGHHGYKHLSSANKIFQKYLIGCYNHYNQIANPWLLLSQRGNVQRCSKISALYKYGHRVLAPSLTSSRYTRKFATRQSLQNGQEAIILIEIFDPRHVAKSSKCTTHSGW